MPTDSPTHPTSTAAAFANLYLTSRRNRRWFWAESAMADQWHGPYNTIDELIRDASVAKYDDEKWLDPRDEPHRISVAPGRRMTKREREEFENLRDMQWHVVQALSFRVQLPSLATLLNEKDLI